MNHGPTASSGPAPTKRIAALDLVRGAVMVLMAVDHVRWFLSEARFNPVNLEKTTAAIFFTRWITHFCAPAFLFLAGTGAYFYGRRVGSKTALSKFLLTRGLWLIVVEWTLARFGWTFNFDYAHYLMGGVIWMIGCSMICLAALVWLPLRATGGLGLAIIAGHNLLDSFPELLRGMAESGWSGLWKVAYLGGGVELRAGGPVLAVLFSVVPWVGVMAAGYAFGAVMELPAEARRRWCYRLGLGAIAAFVVLRGFNLYGDPTPWTAQKNTLFSFLSLLNAEKYPASLSFLLMTLGPTIALLPALEGARGRLAGILTVFGRVPFFYYILHLPAIHLVANALSLARYGEVIPWLSANQPMLVGPPPAGYGYSLAIVYLVTALVVIALYFPCRWFAGLKARRREAWLSFL